MFGSEAILAPSWGRGFSQAAERKPAWNFGLGLSCAAADLLHRLADDLPSGPRSEPREEGQAEQCGAVPALSVRSAKRAEPVDSTGRMEQKSRGFSRFGEVAKWLGNGLQNRYTRVRIPSSPPDVARFCLVRGG